MPEEAKKTEEVTKKDQTPQEQLPQLLKEVAGSPTQEQIDKWKTEYNEVYVSGFSETELYVWRPVFRPEYTKLQAEAQEKGWSQGQFEEAVCSLCVLFPAGVDFSKSKAGTPSTLYEQIAYNSNFYSPAAASMLVARL